MPVPAVPSAALPAASVWTTNAMPSAPVPPPMRKLNVVSNPAARPTVFVRQAEPT